MDVPVSDPVIPAGESFEGFIKDLVLPAHHMERDDIASVFLRIVRILQDIPGILFFLDDLADQKILDRLSCSRIADPVCLDPDTEILTFLRPKIVFPLIKDPVEEPGLIAFHKIQKDFVIFVDQHEPFVRIALSVSVRQFFFCNAPVRTSIFFLGG